MYAPAIAVTVRCERDYKAPRWALTEGLVRYPVLLLAMHAIRPSKLPSHAQGRPGHEELLLSKCQRKPTSRDSCPHKTLNIRQCLSWCGLCLVGCIPAVALQAARRFLIRQKLGIQGDPVKDCCTAFFCQTCAMLQDDVEVRDWQRRKAPYDRPSAPRQPAPFAPMSYPGQPHPNQQTAYPMQPYPQPAMHRGQNFDAGQATYGVAPSQPQPGYY